MFQNDVYLFWYYMRNFTIHFDMPFNSAEATLENGEYVVNFFSTKQHLLEYKEWKHAKTFVKSLPDNINIKELTEQLIVFVRSLHVDLFYLLRNIILDTKHYIESFLDKHLGQTINNVKIGIMAYKN